jgi:Ca2+-binding EF-hand superfamily protein
MSDEQKVELCLIVLLALEVVADESGEKQLVLYKPLRMAALEAGKNKVITAQRRKLRAETLRKNEKDSRKVSSSPSALYTCGCRIEGLSLLVSIFEEASKEGAKLNVTGYHQLTCSQFWLQAPNSNWAHMEKFGTLESMAAEAKQELCQTVVHNLQLVFSDERVATSLYLAMPLQPLPPPNLLMSRELEFTQTKMNVSLYGVYNTDTSAILVRAEGVENSITISEAMWYEIGMGSLATLSEEARQKLCMAVYYVLDYIAGQLVVTKPLRYAYASARSSKVTIKRLQQVKQREQDEQDEATIRIQASMRARQGRREVAEKRAYREQQDEATIRIQSSARARRDRIEVEAKRQARKQQEEEDAMVRLQSMARARQARVEVDAKRRAVALRAEKDSLRAAHKSPASKTAEQLRVDSMQAEKQKLRVAHKSPAAKSAEQLRLEEQSTIRIQSSARARRDRMEVEAKRQARIQQQQEEEDAMVRLQSMARARQARVEVESRKRAASIEQRLLRLEVLQAEKDALRVAHKSPAKKSAEQQRVDIMQTEKAALRVAHKSPAKKTVEERLLLLESVQAEKDKLRIAHTSPATKTVEERLLLLESVQAEKAKLVAEHAEPAVKQLLFQAGHRTNNARLVVSMFQSTAGVRVEAFSRGDCVQYELEVSEVAWQELDGYGALSSLSDTQTSELCTLILSALEVVAPEDGAKRLVLAKPLRFVAAARRREQQLLNDRVILTASARTKSNAKLAVSMYDAGPAIRVEAFERGECMLYSLVVSEVAWHELDYGPVSLLVVEQKQELCSLILAALEVVADNEGANHLVLSKPLRFIATAQRKEANIMKERQRLREEQASISIQASARARRGREEAEAKKSQARARRQQEEEAAAATLAAEREQATIQIQSIARARRGKEEAAQKQVDARARRQQEEEAAAKFEAERKAAEEEAERKAAEEEAERKAAEESISFEMEVDVGGDESAPPLGEAAAYSTEALFTVGHRVCNTQESGVGSSVLLQTCFYEEVSASGAQSLRLISYERRRCVHHTLLVTEQQWGVFGFAKLEALPIKDKLGLCTAIVKVLDLVQGASGELELQLAKPTKKKAVLKKEGGAPPRTLPPRRRNVKQAQVDGKDGEDAGEDDEGEEEDDEEGEEEDEEGEEDEEDEAVGTAICRFGRNYSGEYCIVTATAVADGVVVVEAFMPDGGVKQVTKFSCAQFGVATSADVTKDMISDISVVVGGKAEAKTINLTCQTHKRLYTCGIESASSEKVLLVSMFEEAQNLCILAYDRLSTQQYTLQLGEEMWNTKFGALATMTAGQKLSLCSVVAQALDLDVKKASIVENEEEEDGGEEEEDAAQEEAGAPRLMLTLPLRLEEADTLEDARAEWKGLLEDLRAEEVAACARQDAWEAKMAEEERQATIRIQKSARARQGRKTAREKKKAAEAAAKLAMEQKEEEEEVVFEMEEQEAPMDESSSAAPQLDVEYAAREAEAAARKEAAEVAAKKQAEEEVAAAKKAAEEKLAAAKKAAEEEAAVAKKAAEEAAKKAEEEAAAKKAEEEAAAALAAKQAEEEAAKKAVEEAAAKKQAEEEAAAALAAKQAEEEAAKKAVEEAAAKKQAEEEAAAALAAQKEAEEAAAQKKADDDAAVAAALAAKQAEEEAAAAAVVASQAEEEKAALAKEFEERKAVHAAKVEADEVEKVQREKELAKHTKVQSKRVDTEFVELRTQITSQAPKAIRSQYLKLKNFFNKADKNSDGYIDLEEHMALYAKLKISPSDYKKTAYIKAKFDVVDQDNDGRISLPEYMRAVGLEDALNDDYESVIKAFHDTDKSGNGYISWEDHVALWEQAVSSVDVAKPAFQKAMKEQFQKVDASGNQQVSLEEYVRAGGLFGMLVEQRKNEAVAAKVAKDAEEKAEEEAEKQLHGQSDGKQEEEEEEDDGGLDCEVEGVSGGNLSAPSQQLDEEAAAAKKVEDAAAAQKAEQEHAAATSLQSMVRVGVAKREVDDKRIGQATTHGVLAAMRGTTQGTSGWYHVDNDTGVYFRVADDGGWLPGTPTPVPLSAYKAQMMLAQSSKTLVACPAPVEVKGEEAKKDETKATLLNRTGQLSYWSTEGGKSVLTEAEFTDFGVQSTAAVWVGGRVISGLHLLITITPTQKASVQSPLAKKVPRALFGANSTTAVFAVDAISMHTGEALGGTPASVSVSDSDAGMPFSESTLAALLARCHVDDDSFIVDEEVSEEASQQPNVAEAPVATAAGQWYEQEGAMLYVFEDEEGKKISVTSRVPKQSFDEHIRMAAQSKTLIMCPGSSKLVSSASGAAHHVLMNREGDLTCWTAVADSVTTPNSPAKQPVGPTLTMVDTAWSNNRLGASYEGPPKSRSVWRGGRVVSGRHLLLQLEAPTGYGAGSRYVSFTATDLHTGAPVPFSQSASSLSSPSASGGVGSFATVMKIRAADLSLPLTNIGTTDEADIKLELLLSKVSFDDAEQQLVLAPTPSSPFSSPTKSGPLTSSVSSPGKNLFGDGKDTLDNGPESEAEAAKLIQSGWRRKEAFAKVHEERRKKAEAAGVLLAMPGTVQGKTGYYQDPGSRLIAYFEVNEQVCYLVLQPFDPPPHFAVCCSLVQGEWRPAGAAIELEEWRGREETLQQNVSRMRQT